MYWQQWHTGRIMRWFSQFIQKRTTMIIDLSATIKLLKMASPHVSYILWPRCPTNTSDLAWHFTVTHLIDIIPKFAWIIIKQAFCTGICFQLFLMLFAIPQCKFKHSPCSCHAIKIIPKLAVFIFFNNSYTLICVQLYVSQLTKTYKQTVKIYSRVQRLQPLQHQNSTTIDDICVSW